MDGSDEGRVWWDLRAMAEILILTDPKCITLHKT